MMYVACPASWTAQSTYQSSNDSKQLINFQNYYGLELKKMYLGNYRDFYFK